MSKTTHNKEQKKRKLKAFFFEITHDSYLRLKSLKSKTKIPKIPKIILESRILESNLRDRSGKTLLALINHRNEPLFHESVASIRFFAQ